MSAYEVVLRPPYPSAHGRSVTFPSGRFGWRSADGNRVDTGRSSDVGTALCNSEETATVSASARVRVSMRSRVPGPIAGFRPPRAWRSVLRRLPPELIGLGHELVELAKMSCTSSLVGKRLP